MDLLLIVAFLFVLIFILGLIFAKRNGGAKKAEEAAGGGQAVRRLPPIDNAVPRAAQIRQRRRPFNPGHGFEGAEDDRDEDFDPETGSDIVGLDSKMGKKKQAKLQAKEEKRIQREVSNDRIEDGRVFLSSSSKRWSNVKNGKNVKKN